jgi:hypothetical protein
MKEPAVVREIACFGLAGHGGAWPTEPLSHPGWKSTLGQVDRLRLPGFLQAAIEAEALPVTEQQRQEAADLHLQWCSRALRLEQRLLQLAAILDAHGIEVVVLKGTAVAHLAYPDPAMRHFADLDLLFRSDQFDQALEVFYGLGYVRPHPEARPGFDRRFGKGATLQGIEGDELDAHRNLVLGTFGFTIGLGELFRSREAFHLGGRELWGLGPEGRLLHACYHAALGDPYPRYGSVRDIAQMLTTGSHDPQRVVELARAWEAEAVLARGIDLCRNYLGVAVGGPVVEAVANYEPSRRERRAIRAYVGANHRFAAKAVASLPYMTGVRERAAFLRAVVAPDPGFVEAVGAQPGRSWITRGLRSMAGSVRPR